MTFWKLTSAKDLDAWNFDDYNPSVLREDLLRARTEIQAGIEKIASSAESPTFENTILALEVLFRPIERIFSAITNAVALLSSPDWLALAKDASQVNADLQNDVLFHPELFRRIRFIHQTVLPSISDEETITYVRQSYQNFLRKGAQLGEEDKKRLREIDADLARLEIVFAENLRGSSEKFRLHLTDEEDLEGLQESAIAKARSEAKDRGGWVFTLRPQSYAAFMGHSTRPDLREKMWKGFTRRGTEAGFDNAIVAKAQSQLRLEKARLLGFPSFADLMQSEGMAGSPEKVRAFIEELLPPAKEAAKERMQVLADIKREKTGIENLDPWDLRFYKQRLMERSHNFSENEFEPFLELSSVIRGSLELASKLFGLAFKQGFQLPTYDASVLIYDAYEDSGTYKGRLYLDLFSRENKSAGAWCARFQVQWKDQGDDIRPQVVIACNFSKAPSDRRTFLSLAETRVFMHEFGHGLHSLLSDCKYSALSCTSVARDFVELPSKLMEKWLEDDEGLKTIARHWETDAVMSEEQIQTLKGVLRLQAADDLLFHLRNAALDLAWHAAEIPKDETVEDWEGRVLGKYQLLPSHNENISAAFSHIFAHSYACFFYSYKWSEALAADAFSLFHDEGPGTKDAAERLRKNILERGGSASPEILYRRFRGRDMDLKYFLRNETSLARPCGAPRRFCGSNR